MKKLLYAAALLMGACTAQPQKQAGTPATPVEMSEQIQLVAPDSVGGTSINEALAARRSW